MYECVIIINNPHFTWVPPLYGEIKICIDQFLSRSNTNSIVHVCVDNCERLTYCNENIIPALFTFLCGKKVNLYKHFNLPETNIIKVTSPVTFYFTDENNHVIRDNTPIIRCKISYV